MNANLKRLTPIFCVGMLMYSGCTKQQSVKVDPSLAPSATTVSQSAQPQSGASGAVQQEQARQENAATASAVAASSPQKGEQTLPPQAVKHLAAADLQSGYQNIYFDFDSSALSEAARKTLTGNFERLKENPRAELRIGGHCDERGSDEYNLALSERRARTALNYLTALGIPAERLSAVGYGEEKPADPGHDQAAWDKNRRDEFAIVK